MPKSTTKKLNSNKPTLTYLDEYKLEESLNFLQDNTHINTIIMALPVGVSTNIGKNMYQFKTLDETSQILQGKNSDVVFSIRGKLFYPVRLMLSRSHETVRMKLSLYAPLQVSNKANFSKLHGRIVQVKSGTIFELQINTLDKKKLYSLIGKLMREVKKAVITYSTDDEILDKFSEDIIST